MGVRDSCPQVLMVIINLLFSVIGILLLAAACVVRYGSDMLDEYLRDAYNAFLQALKEADAGDDISLSNLNIGDLISDATIAFIVIGAFFFCLGVAGCIGACSRNMLLLAVFDCCGVDSYKEFEKATKWNNHVDNITLMVPLFCCKNLSDHVCRENATSANSYIDTSCYSVLRDWATDRKPILIGFGTGVAVVQVNARIELAMVTIYIYSALLESYLPSVLAAIALLDVLLKCDREPDYSAGLFWTLPSIKRNRRKSFKTLMPNRTNVKSSSEYGSSSSLPIEQVMILVLILINLFYGIVSDQKKGDDNDVDDSSGSDDMSIHRYHASNEDNGHRNTMYQESPPTHRLDDDRNSHLQASAKYKDYPDPSKRNQYQTPEPYRGRTDFYTGPPEGYQHRADYDFANRNSTSLKDETELHVVSEEVYICEVTEVTLTENHAATANSLVPDQTPTNSY